MYVEIPKGKNGVIISEIRGYTSLEELKRNIDGRNWRRCKIYKVYPDSGPRRLKKAELLELGAVEID